LQAFIHALLRTSVNAAGEMIVAKAQPQKLFPRFCRAVHFVRAVTSAFWHQTDLPPQLPEVRYQGMSGPGSGMALGLSLTHFVVKVENRTTLKLSRKLTFGLLCCFVAFQRYYGGP
jgi:hypothetical protein